MNNNNNSNFGDLLASQSTNNNNHNKLTTLNIGSLNCRGLRKTTNPATSAAFIRYLRTVSLDILALQETHADTDEIAHLFKTQFQVNTSYWSNYSGIICFSPFLSLSEPIWNTIQRTPTVKVSHVHEAFDPVFVTAVYAPADTARRLSYLQSSLLNPYKKITLPSPPKGNPRYSLRLGVEITKVKENATIIKYACPSCNNLLKDLDQLVEHIDAVHINERFTDNTEKIEKSVNQEINAYATDEDLEDDDIDLDALATDLDNEDLTPEDFISERNEALPIIKPNLKLDMPSTTQSIDKPTKKLRTYNEAITYACQQKGTENDKNKTMFIVDTLSLKPFAILDNHGNEENALAHDTIVNKLVTKHDSIKSIPTMKRPYKDDSATNSLCINCSSQVHAELSNLFDTSPYSSLLKQREYTPLTDDICTLLNKDWQFYPQVKYFSATVFAGSIILNTNNNQAIMINTVEMYGRTKITDYHRESFGKLKNSVIKNSLPPPIKIFHQNVWPTSLDVRDGKKLVIGTQVSNALVTSSIRLDEKGLVSIGATSSHFMLDTIKDSLASKIFIDLNSLKSAKALIEDPSTTHVSDIGIVFHQLRQVRTKFHLPSTYSLCRASGPITINHTCHPFSLFTLSEFDRGRSPSASIFRTIANEVLSNNSDAKLAKEDVSRWINESKGKRKAILSNILDLYESDKDWLPILYNAPLNKELEALAILLIPTIVEANKSVEAQVKQVFEVFGCL
ncbi:hypothetical protein G6F70_000515 [Rhizopus microsporus]|nr:hypothetical protein G6F71_001486 [Rhizopus microsporus]KAG1204391.1 hypothetical protein G6F70_000515 [Rhizopus microsporus]KAG1215071.1 hypothetical protein G6F69_001335 [Rhizopus microsporus]KAG1237439.1 hypothetical protein G6F67_001195 [Rhizopus microsporus]KAG1269400.1 hypothetical protein G6F68_000307 [Rhizopus microsporus]